jgi:hypothetical protein
MATELLLWGHHREAFLLSRMIPTVFQPYANIASEAAAMGIAGRYPSALPRFISFNVLG